MYNVVMLVGRVAELALDNEFITLKVTRTFKNSDGIYEEDLIPCKVSIGVSNMNDYISVNDVIGIKGRLQVVADKIYIIADKVTFITSTVPS